MGPHLPTTVVDVRLWLHHTPLTIAPPTLQRLHLRLYFHFTSSELLSSATFNYLHAANQQRAAKMSSRRTFSKQDSRPAKDCTWSKTSWPYFPGLHDRLIVGIPPWAMMPGHTDCNISAHPAAVVGTPLMTGSKLVTYKLLQGSAGFLCSNRNVSLHAIKSELKELYKKICQ